MYKLGNIIEECSLINLCGSYLSYRDKKRKRLVFNGIVINIDPWDWHYNEMHNYLIIKDIDWNSFIYNIDNQYISKIEQNLIIPIHSSDYLIAIIDTKLTILDSVNLEFISTINTSEISFRYSYFEHNKLFLTKEFFLHSYSIKKGEKLWQFDLSQFGTYPFRSEGERPYEVERFIGVVDNILWIEISNYTLLALDINTGKLISLLDLNTKVPETTFLDSGFLLDETKNRIVWLARTALFHIDLQTLDVKFIKDFWNVDKPDRWSFRRKMLDGDKIYFAGIKGNESTWAERIGVMNSETGDILWNVHLPDSKNLQTPQVSENKLYVLGTSGNLYIFEKE